MSEKKEPLTREQQIELMETAPERYRALMKRLLDIPGLREALRRKPHSLQGGDRNE